MDKGLMKERIEERRNGNRRWFKKDWGKEKADGNRVGGQREGR